MSSHSHSLGPMVEDLVNCFRFTDRKVFDQTLSETEVQYEIGIDNGRVLFGMRHGLPVALFDIDGADSLAILAPGVD